MRLLCNPRLQSITVPLELDTFSQSIPLQALQIPTMDLSPLSLFQVHLRSKAFPNRKPVHILRPRSAFLKLPTEIRLIIYKHAFRGRATLKERMALPITCRQTYDEYYDMALSSTIIFRSTTRFVSFWRRAEPSRRKHIRDVEIEIRRAVQIYIVPRELQRSCAGLEGECEGLRLRSLILVINTALDALEVAEHLASGIQGMISVLKCTDRIDKIGIVDRLGTNMIPTDMFWNAVAWEARARWISLPLLDESREVHGRCFSTRESLTKSGMEQANNYSPTWPTTSSANLVILHSNPRLPSRNW